MKKRFKQLVGSLALMGACLSHATLSNVPPGGQEAPVLGPLLLAGQ